MKIWKESFRNSCSNLLIVCDPHVVINQKVVAMQMHTQTAARHQSQFKAQAEQKSQVRVQCIAKSNP